MKNEWDNIGRYVDNIKREQEWKLNQEKQI